MTKQREDDDAVSPALARLREAVPTETPQNDEKVGQSERVEKATVRDDVKSSGTKSSDAESNKDSDNQESKRIADLSGDGLSSWLDNIEVPTPVEISSRVGRWRARRAAEKALERKNIEAVRAKAAAREEAAAAARARAEEERLARLATLTGPIEKVPAPASDAPKSTAPASKPTSASATAPAAAPAPAPAPAPALAPVQRTAPPRTSTPNRIANDAQHLDRSGARRRTEPVDKRRQEDDLAHLVEEAREAVLQRNQTIPGVKKSEDQVSAEANAAKAAEKPKPRRRNPLMDQRIAEQLAQEEQAQAQRPVSRAVLQPTARPHQPVWEIETVPATVYVAPYNLPSKAPNPKPELKDFIRRLVVTLVILASAAVAFIRLGIFGGPGVHDREFSPYDPNVSLLSMGTVAYLLWGLIYLWLVVYAGYQWTRDEASSLRQRRLGYPVAAAAMLGALWLVFAGQGSDGYGMLASLAMVGVLVYCLNVLNQHTARTRDERVAVDGPVGLFLGFGLTVAAMNVAIFLTTHNIKFLLPGEWWAALVVVGMTWLAATLTMTERGRIVMALGYGFGLFWIMTSRLFGSNSSALVAILAGMCGFIVVLATENRRYQISHAERRALRGKPTEF
ncbi:hypothetical protein [Neomicrococcus lactis]|uniref:MFS family permease n=1 Tax=Neomicrococcus lactis TaxID=732241 RepID=A0A7W8YBU4_9MICC|nr:hypothetical protein [Neomicrococcus lactis]MBB5598516.1 MFS family permease [Neomicrococcus lactis]